MGLEIETPRRVVISFVGDVAQGDMRVLTSTRAHPSRILLSVR